MMNPRMTQESVRVDEPFYLPTCRREKAAGRFQHRRVIVEQPDRGSRFGHQSLTKPGLDGAPQGCELPRFGPLRRE